MDRVKKNIQKDDRNMQLDYCEKEALMFALKNFKGEVYLFGSRFSNKKNGGDIDLLLIPNKKVNPLKLALRIQTRFFLKCEERIDVVVYNDSIFCKEVLTNAKNLDLKRM